MKKIFINQNQICKLLIYLSFLLFPFQNLALRISSSSYDLTAIILIISIFLFFILNDFQKFSFRKKIAIIYTLIFIAYYLMNYILNYIAPLPRFLASLLWLVGLLNIIILSSEVKINQRSIFNIINLLLILICAHIWIEYFFIIGPDVYNTDIKARGMSFFAEPSYAGLILYASSIGYFFIFLLKFSKIYLFLFLLNFATGYITLSLHIVTFIVSLLFFIVIFSFAFKKNINFKINFKINSKFYLYIFILFISSICSIYLIFFGEFANHFVSRLDIFNFENTTNVSLLCWLRGMDQAIASIHKSYYLFGTGLGSTGEFQFYSEFGNKLQIFGLGSLTLKDSYSLFFRLIIEMGLLTVIIFLVYLLYRLKHFYNFICKKSSRSKAYIVFNFLFGISILIGSLLKEPNFSRSSLYISLFLISSINFDSKKIKIEN